MESARGTVNINFRLWCNWKDERLALRERNSNLPNYLWSPRLTLKEAIDNEFVINTKELYLNHNNLEGNMTSITWYSGTIINNLESENLK